MATPEAQREYQRQWVARRRAEWFAANGPCTDCGSESDLQLDHVNPAEKVSHSIWSWSAARREAELAKCVVRCSSCHVKKTIRNNDHLHSVRGRVLTEVVVVEIRRQLLQGVAQRVIAHRVGVSQGTISKINRGEMWA